MIGISKYSEAIKDNIAKIYNRREQEFSEDEDIHQPCDVDHKVFEISFRNVTNQVQSFTFFDSGITKYENVIQYGDFGVSEISAVAVVDSVNAIYDPVGDVMLTLQGGTRLVTYDSNNNVVTNFDLTSISGLVDGNSIAFDTTRRHLAVAESLASAIYVYNLDTLTLDFTISPLSSTQVTDIQYSSAFDRYYCATKTNIDVYDAGTGAVVASIVPPIGVGGVFAGYRCLEVGNFVYFSDIRPSFRMFAFDQTLLTASAIPLTVQRSTSLSFNPSTNQVLTCASADDFSVVDASTNLEVSSFAIGGFTGFGGAAFDPTTSKFIVTDASKTYQLDSAYNVENTITTGKNGVSVGFRPDGTGLILNTDASISALSPAILSGAIQFDDIDSYNFFNQGLRVNPKKVSCINVVVGSTDQFQFTMPFTRKDASGKAVTDVALPNIKVSPWQENSFRALTPTPGVILDGLTQLTYSVQPNESVSFTIYYREWKRVNFIDAFMEGERIPLFEKFENATGGRVVRKQKSPIFDSGIEAFDRFFQRSVVNYASLRGVYPIEEPEVKPIFVDTGELEFGSPKYHPNKKIDVPTFAGVDLNNKNKSGE